MDRMQYRGPTWEGIGVPKSIIEEVDPTYDKVDSSDLKEPEGKQGKKSFDYVVRWSIVLFFN